MLAKNCINALQMRFSFVFYTANIEQEIKCLGSSPETVRKAFRELQHYGVIEKMRRGYFVTADEAVVMAYRQQYLTTIEKKYLVAKAKVEI